MYLLEKELKIRLSSREDYSLVKKVLGDPFRIAEQVNIYFDSDDRELHRSGVMLRLRTTDKQWVVTVKSGEKSSQGYFKAKEWEKEVPPLRESQNSLAEADLVAIAADHLATVFPSFAHLSLTIQGKIENRRYCYQKEREVWELDHTRFPSGKEDFEIEVETNDPARVDNELKQFFTMHNLPFSYQSKTKYCRFLEDIGKE